jgi:putative hydrolase of the HAD superfamily
MNYKAIMVDVDGVLIQHPHKKGWSIDLERDLGISPDALHTAFFAPHWDDVVNGRAALRDRLAIALAEIAPSLKCATIIDYWFSNDAHINHDLLNELAELRRGDVEVHLATVQEHERAAHLWETLDLKSHFDGMHYAAALGCSKPEAQFYKCIEAQTGFAPKDMFFIDDKKENVEGALACGWNAALWTGNDTLRSLLQQQF